MATFYEVYKFFSPIIWGMFVLIGFILKLYISSIIGTIKDNREEARSMVTNAANALRRELLEVKKDLNDRIDRLREDIY